MAEPSVTAGFEPSDAASLGLCETAKVDVIHNSPFHPKVGVITNDPFHPPWWGQGVAEVVIEVGDSNENWVKN